MPRHASPYVGRSPKVPGKFFSRSGAPRRLALAELRRIEIFSLNDAPNAVQRAFADLAGLSLDLELSCDRFQELRPLRRIERPRKVHQGRHFGIGQLQGRRHGRSQSEGRRADHKPKPQGFRRGAASRRVDRMAGNRNRLAEKNRRSLC
jgi:hypothetical protein